MKFIPIFFLTVCCSLSALEKIELVSIYPCDTTALSEHATIIKTDLSDYKGLEKKRTLWTRLLKKCGVRPINTISLNEGISKLVFFNIDVHYRRQFDLIKLPKEKLVLFMWEPPNALRKMYGKKVKECFSKIYTWDDSLVDNQTYFKFYYPSLLPMLKDLPSFEEKKLCTLVSSNARSKHPNALYDERKKAIEFFEKIGEEGFEFYGRGWDPKEHPSYRGAVKEKLEIIKNYRFSICYENSKDIEGYVTEKIFDCFAAGNVPVYWGASNIESYIPKECFIDRRAFNSLEGLYIFLKNMSKEDYETYLVNIKTYLESDQAKLFSPEHFKEIFAKAIRD